MKGRLSGKALIVIGAASGIGAATVRWLVREGARVCAADINLAGAQDVAAEALAQGNEAFAVPIDIANEASVNAAVADAVAQLGHLDGAHLNAANLRVIFSDSDALDVGLRPSIAPSASTFAVTCFAPVPSCRTCWRGAAVRSSTRLRPRHKRQSPCARPTPSRKAD